MIPLLFILGFYLLSLVFVSPLGSYIVNDEWIFFRQVEAFSEGILTVNSLVDPSFLLQGVLGAIFSKLFGFSFQNMHFFAIIFGILTLIGLYLLLVGLKVSRKVSVFTTALVMFNPLVFHLSQTFMTEIFFLCFSLWGVFFLVKYLNVEKIILLVVSGSLFGAAVLIRQTGLIFLPLSLILLQKKSLKLISSFSIPIILAFLAYLIWPRHALEGGGLLGKLATFEHIIRTFPMYIYSFFYFALFFIPLFINFKFRNKALYIVFIIFTILIYMLNVFPIGNVLLLEGIFTENEIINYLSIFNNPIFKLVISIFVSVSSINLFIFLRNYLREKNYLNWYLFAIALAFFGANLIISDFYDRYLVVTFVFLAILISRSISITRTSWVLLVFSILITLFLQKDFLTVTKARWEMAESLQQTTGNLLTIGVDSAYGKYYKAKIIKDYTGFVYPNPTDCCSCRVTQIPDYDTGIQDFTTSELYLYMQQINPKPFEADSADSIGYQNKTLDSFTGVIATSDQPLISTFGLLDRVTVGWCN